MSSVRDPKKFWIKVQVPNKTSISTGPSGEEGFRSEFTMLTPDGEIFTACTVSGYHHAPSEENGPAAFLKIEIYGHAKPFVVAVDENFQLSEGPY